MNRTMPNRLDHHIFTKGEWWQAQLKDHPTVPITISVDKPATITEKAHSTQVTTTAIADTGTQSNLWSLEEYLSCGFSRDDLHPVCLSLTAANRTPIRIEGAFFAKLVATLPSGKTTSSHSMVYISSSIRAMYLSYKLLLNLGLLSKKFPSPEGTQNNSATNRLNATPAPLSTNANRFINNGCEGPQTSSHAACSCPQRTAPPLRPAELPFPFIPENNKQMKTWLLERCASSAFNTCPHQALPCMDGPPIEKHADPTATAKALHTPATIPIHWQKKVYEDLLCDEVLGVVECIPYGEPVTWCHRVVVTRKHNSSPRWTVDLSSLNKFYQPEMFAMELAFHLARRVPKDTWKTVTDTWNGYHSVPLRTSDRHLTTFITPFGCWCYNSTDGYNRQFDCVEDTIHYDADLKQHSWRTIDFLTWV